MNICIFCSARELEEKYIMPAMELSTLLAKAGHHLVWGGSHMGLMKTVADTFREHGGKIYGVSVEVYRDKVHKTADAMLIAKDLGARKAAMLAKSDIVITLPGGIGALDEITDVLELRKQAHHDKPIIVLNTDNFYAGLITQLTKMQVEGFINADLGKLIYFADTPRETLAYIDSLK